MKTYDNNDEVALVFKRLAKSQDFMDALSILERKFDAPNLVPNVAADGFAIALLTQHRIGEQNVIKYIRTMMNREFDKNAGTSRTNE